jgi:hypothetical protein
MSLTKRARSARRHVTAVSMADLTGTVGLIFGGFFWINLYWNLYDPIDPAEQVLIGIAAFLHALSMPVLWSALVPTTPAAQLLQKTKWQTIGFYFIIGFVIFLTVIAGYLIYQWQISRDAVRDSGLAGLLTIVWLILSVGVPALSFVQSTPEQWLKQVEQWQAVKRLDIHFKQELILAREAYGRALAILRYGLDRATVEQRQYVADVWQGMHIAEQENLRAIATTLRDEGDIVLAVSPESNDLATVYGYIADAIIETRNEGDLSTTLERSTQRGAFPASAASAAVPVRNEPAHTGETQLATVSAASAAVPVRNEPAHLSRHEPVHTGETQLATVSAASSGVPRRNEPARRAYSEADNQAQRTDEVHPADAFLPVARKVLPPVWGRAELEKALSISKPTANRYIVRWLESGDAKQVDGSAITRYTKYHFTQET